MFYRMLLVATVLAAGGIPTVRTANILLFPFAHCINSHLLNFEKLAAILLQDGHQVTMLVSDKYDGPHSGANLSRVRLIRFKSPENVSVICRFKSLQTFLDTPLWQIIATFYKSTFAFCDSLLSDDATMRQIKRERFDLAIYDAVDQCSRIVADYVDIPFIVFYTQGLENVFPRHPAYLPSLLTTYSDTMTLHQRVFNTFGWFAQKLIGYLTLKYYQQLKLSHNINTTRHIQNSYKAASLRFILGDHALDYVGPMQPSDILIGGFVQSEPKTIPSRITDFLSDTGEEGVVLFSFGSILEYYGPVWREIFAEALSRLPHRVIWRYNETLPTNLGNNTLLVPWLPQADLLAHPKVQVFVSHCGLNAAYEASFYGVPVVAIPLFADQSYQATKLTSHADMGMKVSIHSMTADTLYDAIMTVDMTSRYRVNAKRISFIMNNKPQRQRDEITHWVNYVVRLQGAPHLKSKEHDLTLCQYLMVDVLLILLASFVSMLVVTFFSTKFAFKAALHLLVTQHAKTTSECTSASDCTSVHWNLPIVLMLTLIRKHSSEKTLSRNYDGFYLRVLSV